MKLKIPNLKFQILALLLTGLLWFSQAQAVTLYSGTANQVVYQDQTFVVNWFLDTVDEEVNTVYLKLNYSKENLEVVSASTGNSDLDLWIKPPAYSNESGTIELTGGIAGGIKSTQVNLFSATFLAKGEGAAKISMDESSTVLLADGEGTATQLLFKQLGFTVNPAGTQPSQISSSTHTIQTAWYQDNQVVINFERKDGEIYSYGFSSNLEIFPDDKPDDPAGELVFDNLPDGIYYFKLNSKVGAAPWQEAGVYRVQIDTTPPQTLQAEVASDPQIFNGSPFISIAGTDKESGVSHYEIRFGEFGRWQQVSDTVFKIPGLVLGDRIEVKVVDQAGNEQIRTIEIKGLAGQGSFTALFIWIILIIAAVLAILAFVVYPKLRKKYKI